VKACCCVNLPAFGSGAGEGAKRAGTISRRVDATTCRGRAHSVVLCHELIYLLSSRINKDSVYEHGIELESSIDDNDGAFGVTGRRLNRMMEYAC
jgi:hypothetical protein